MKPLWVDTFTIPDDEAAVFLMFRCEGCDRRFWERAEKDSLVTWIASPTLGKSDPGTESGLKVALESSMCGRCWTGYTGHSMEPSTYLDPPPGEDS